MSEKEKNTDIFSKIPQLNYKEDALETSLEEFRKVIDSRRSVRVYKEDPIPEDVVRECLEMALLAPNSSNLQTWQFFWVKSPEKRKQVVEACFSQPAARTASELIVAVARIDVWKDHCKRMVEVLKNTEPPAPKSAFAYYQKVIPLAYTMDPFGLLGLLKWLVVNTAGVFRPTPREPTSWGDIKTWAVKSCALACENLMLAFRAAGYDTCPMEGYDSKRLKKALHLSRKALPVMVISAGKRADNGVYGARIRFPSDEFIIEV